MSLLEALRSGRSGLQRTRTTVTRADGTQYIEDGGVATQQLTTRSYGFVVDTKPDRVPAKIVDFVYLGSQDAADISVLSEYSITYVLSVGVPLAGGSTYDDVVNKYLPCLDLPDAQLDGVLDAACEFIDAAVRAKCNILVHCNAGVSRSPAVIIAYLMRRNRMTYCAAHAHVKRLRPSIRPNDGFVQQLNTPLVAAPLPPPQ